jgi:hypothetical protein
MRAIRPVAALGAVLATAALLLGSCGAASPVVTPKSDTLPLCDEVWVAGQTLPQDYDGCRDAEGVLVVSDIKRCTASDGKFTTFAARYYGMLGGPVKDDGQQSTGYNTAYLACFGSNW